MKKLLKNLGIVCALTSTLILGSCGTKQVNQPTTNEKAPEVQVEQTDDKEEVTLTVGATSVPHAEILNAIVDDLKAEGINLVIKESDYTLLNQATVDGSIDANFFQHIPYLTDFNKNTNNDLVSVGPIHIEPLGVYSKKITELSAIEDGSKIAIPNDGSNESRALQLLASQGLITLDPNKIEGLGLLDITENPKNLNIVEMDAQILPNTLTDVAVAVINGNYAMQANLVPAKDALVLESATDSPYANCLVVKSGNEKTPEIEALYKALTSDKVKNFIDEKYNGSVIPAF